MKSKYLQIKKREAAYHAACDKAEERYLTEVFELVKNECDRWGLEFGAGNGIYVFTLPSTNRHLMKLKSAAGYLQCLNQPGCDLIELISPELFELLESDLHGSRGCCIGCQIENYASSVNDDKLVCIQSDELEIDYEATPKGTIISLQDAKEISYGPMRKNLAQIILNTENAHEYWQLFDEFNVNY